TTAATRDIARFILLDAAHLQEEEFSIQQRKHRRSGLPVRPPLYSVEDVLYMIDQCEPRARYEEPLELAPGIGATFRDAGHILGSAFIELQIEEGKKTERVTFSGDLGNLGQHVVPDPAMPHECDLVVTESTYGDRDHRSVAESVKELAEAVSRTLEQGGNVIIPTFALERAQDVLFYLGQLRREGEIPECPIYLDSPLAINITEVYRRHPESLDAKLREMIDSGERPFLFAEVSFTRATEESKRLNEARGAIIMAGSGMCTGGRVLHHLRHNLWRAESSVVLVGYQARRTLGRALVEGAKRVRIYGEEIAVKAKIYTINGFSAHADQTGLLRWLGPCRGKRALLVHGENHALATLKALAHERLGMEAQIARFGEPVSL
ncbi:MAG: MBL fold metallo-hydrolase RNA specificity domain-containing protein, partial [Candidatus Bipolaricaulia bacterium]